MSDLDRKTAGGRGRILDASARLVRREGVRRLTIERVATEARLSRGGVLYHFGSKEALIQGMLARLTEQFEAQLDLAAGNDLEPRGSWARAYLRASLGMDEETTELFSALIAAIAYDPRLLDPLRVRLAEWRRRTEEGLDPISAAICRLASHALWLNGIFQMENLSPAERRAIVDRLTPLLDTPDQAP